MTQTNTATSYQRSFNFGSDSAEGTDLNTQLSAQEFENCLKNFSEFGASTKAGCIEVNRPGEKGISTSVFINEFWTSKQRAACSLHEISYRACFKPQLPRFFISRLTKKGDLVYDPFMGRGTTLVEAGLMGRVPCGCDINPLSEILCKPRLAPPTFEEVAERLKCLSLSYSGEIDEELLTFYHPKTLSEIYGLRDYLLNRTHGGEIDNVDEWIRMTATNRLTGHSAGFFSVYTLPPNQATSVRAQKKINEKRGQVPPPRDVKNIILKKSKSLLRTLDSGLRSNLKEVEGDGFFVTSSANETPSIPDDSISLVVTSPPFLDVVDYKIDNWLRCWFNGMDSAQIPIWHLRSEDVWQNTMASVFTELKRVLKPGGFVAFEVGEIRGGSLSMEELVLPAAISAGLNPILVMINAQEFTKTAQCWGVDNSVGGTNTNRIVLLQK